MVSVKLPSQLPRKFSRAFHSSGASAIRRDFQSVRSAGSAAKPIVQIDRATTKKEIARDMVRSLSRCLGGAACLLYYDPLITEFLVSLFEQVLVLESLEFTKRFGHVLFQAMSGLFWIALSAAKRFGDAAVNHSKLLEIAAGEFERFGKSRCSVRLLQQDRTARFRADHGVPGEFHHRDSIRYADTQCSAAAAFAADDTDDRHTQAAHFH